MATEQIYVIRSDTGATPPPDYTTIEAFNADIGTGIPSDFVANDIQVTAVLYNDSTFTPSDFDTASHTADATRFLRITVADGHSFQDQPDAADVRLYPDQARGVLLNPVSSKIFFGSNNRYVQFHRLQVTISTFGTLCAAREDMLFKDLLIVHSRRDGGFNETWVPPHRTRYENVVAICTNTSTSSFVNGFRTSGANDVEFDHCTAIYAGVDTGSESVRGFQTGSGVSGILMRNCIAVGYAANGSSDDFRTGITYAAGSGNNISQDLSAPGSNSITGADPAQLFVSYPSNVDARVVESSVADGAGQYLVTVPDDIVLQTRSDPPTIGAFELDTVAATPSVTVEAKVKNPDGTETLLANTTLAVSIRNTGVSITGADTFSAQRTTDANGIWVFEDVTLNGPISIVSAVLNGDFEGATMYATDVLLD